MGDEEGRDGASAWLFLVGLVVFLGSLLLFLADLVRGIDIFRSVVANAVGAVLLMAWAAFDTVADPDSGVSSTAGAAGTALLLYGLYLSIAGTIITLTGLLIHDRVVFGLAYLGLAAIAGAFGFVVFPHGAIVDDDTADGSDGDDTADGSDGDDTADGNDDDDTADENDDDDTADGNDGDESHGDG